MNVGTILERTMMGRARMAIRVSGRVEGSPMAIWWTTRATLPRIGRHGTVTHSLRQKLYSGYTERSWDDRSTALAVAKGLNADGIPMWHKYHPRGREEATYHSKPGAVWQANTVAGIIRSETYKVDPHLGTDGQPDSP